MTRARSIAIAAALTALLIAGVIFRSGSNAACARGDANAVGAIHDRQSARPVRHRATDETQSLCTARYLQAHPLAVAAEGGLKGVPRNINKNFKAWREGPNVWICPTNRIGPVYQFVFENGIWRFDGPVGILRSWGDFVPISELPDAIPE